MREYWDLTLAEIKDIIDSFERTETRRKKQRIEELFVLAEVTANRVLCGLNGKSNISDYAQPYHYYPDLFENIEEKLLEQQEEEEFRRYTEDMKVRAELWNKRFRERNNGSGKISNTDSNGNEGCREEAQADSKRS